jgi:hypothetical protein
MSATSSKLAAAVGLLLGLTNPASSAGSSIFAENFSSTMAVDADQFAPSEKWGPNTEYRFNPSDPDWVFSGTSVLVINPADGDQAMALNEAPVHGAATTNPIAGFTPGQMYVLTLDHWGDDRPLTDPYEVDVKIDGNLIGHLSRIYPTPGPGATDSFTFLATAPSHTLSFADVTFVGQASAILDNICIRLVPESSAHGLLFIALLLSGNFDRRCYK